MLLQPKNWGIFQHYKDRSPPWIKLHRDLLSNRDYIRLPNASKALAPLLWLLASEKQDGIFDGSFEELQFRLHITRKEYDEGIKSLIDKGFFLDASNVLAECLQDAIPEGEGEGEGERERETEKEGEQKKMQRGTRLPQDFQLSDEWIYFCQQQRPELRPRDVFDGFRDYWIAQPGQKGVKTDWAATWRNWVRRQQTPKKTSVEERRSQMAELTRGLSVPKPKPFWSKSESTEAPNVEPKRLL